MGCRYPTKDMPKRNAAKRRRMLNGEDKKNKEKEKQSTQEYCLDAFNLAALTHRSVSRSSSLNSGLSPAKLPSASGSCRGLGYPSLPPKHYGEEVPQVELRPHYVKEDDFGIFVCLPEHEVA